MPIFIGIGDPSIFAWLGILENLAGNVLLGTSIIKQCICRIFPTEPKIVLWHSNPVAIISTQTATNSINADSTELNVKTLLQDEASKEECHPFCVAHQVTISAHRQAALLVRCRGAPRMKIETHRSVVEHRCPMTAQGLMDIVPGKPFYVYILYMTAKAVNFPKFVVVS